MIASWVSRRFCTDFGVDGAALDLLPGMGGWASFTGVPSGK